MTSLDTLSRQPIFDGNSRPNSFSALHATLANAETAYQNHALTDGVTFKDDTLTVGRTTCRMSDSGLDRLCKQVGAPVSYLRKLPAEKRAELIRLHLKNGDHLGRGQATDLAMVSRNGDFVGFSRNDLIEFRSGDVLEAIRDGVGSGIDQIIVNRTDVGRDSFEFELVSPEVAEEVREGDVVQAGLHVAYSPIAEFATRIEAYVLRLVCMNGMTHRQCVSNKSISRTRRLAANHPDAKQLQYDQVRRLTEQTWQSLRPQLHSIQSLTSERVTVRDLLARFLRRARLFSQNTMRLLQDAWESEGAEETAFAAFNAITNVATHRDELSTAHRRSLSSLAGVLANRSTHICPRCFSVVSNN